MKIKTRQDFLVVLTVAVVGLAVLLNFILPPITSWWSGRQKQIADLRDEVAHGKQDIRRDKYIRDEWNDMLDNSLPASAPQAEQQFLKGMDEWSRESGATITSIMPQWKNDATNYMTLDCRLEADGDLNALTRFVYDLERGPMPLRLDSIELSSHDNAGQQMTLGLEINGLALLANIKK
jgi:hypothetical protein